jgi:signal transduction histidine kinase
MTPSTQCRELLGPYSEGLLAYLAEGHESALERARELGRSALANGVGASEMYEVHHKSISRILALIDNSDECKECGKRQQPRPCEGIYQFLKSLTAADAVAAAGTFFAETMAPFEARERETRKSNIALRYQNRKLESDVHRFTQVVYDDALQLLAAARLAMAASTGQSQPAVCGPLNEVEGMLERVEEQLAACSADNLRLRVLEDLGLGAAIQSLAWRFSESSRLEITTEGTIGPVTAEIGMALYRSVLEALTNVAQHARAKRVSIRLYEESSVIHCSVRDDGVGFDVPAVLPQVEDHGSGFGSMAEHLRWVGGTLYIDSALGRGTEVRMSIDQRTSEH